MSLLVKQEVGIEPILHYTCRDRNVLGIQSDLLGRLRIGIRNLICITGDPPKMGDYPDATAVFDVDSIGLVNIVHNLNRGLDIGGNPLGTRHSFVIAVGANPGVPNIDEEIRRFEYKVEAGAEWRSRSRYSISGCWKTFLRRIEHCKMPVVAGIWPLVERAQCRVHEERVASLGAGLDSRTHGRRPRPPKPRAPKASPSPATCWSPCGIWCRAHRSARPWDDTLRRRTCSKPWAPEPVVILE